TSRAVEAQRRAVECSDQNPVMLAGLARALAVAGDRAAALAIAKPLDQHLFAYELALVHLALGELAPARELIDEARRQRSGWMVYLDVDPRLDALRGSSAALE